MDEQNQKHNFSMIAIVAIVAIVALVVLVMNVNRMNAPIDTTAGQAFGGSTRVGTEGDPSCFQCQACDNLEGNCNAGDQLACQLWNEKCLQHVTECITDCTKPGESDDPDDDKDDSDKGCGGAGAPCSASEDCCQGLSCEGTLHSTYCG